MPEQNSKGIDIGAPLLGKDETASQSCGASNNRGHCSRDSDEDGQRPKRPEGTKTRPPETRSRLEPWSRKRPQEPRKVRDGRPKRPGNQTKNAKVNLHPSEEPEEFERIPTTTTQGIDMPEQNSKGIDIGAPLLGKDETTRRNKECRRLKGAQAQTFGMYLKTH